MFQTHKPFVHLTQIKIFSMFNVIESLCSQHFLMTKFSGELDFMMLTLDSVVDGHIVCTRSLKQLQ